MLEMFYLIDLLFLKIISRKNNAFCGTDALQNDSFTCLRDNVNYRGAMRTDY